MTTLKDSYGKRRRLLIKAGLIRDRDFKTKTRSNADKLRRLEKRYQLNDKNSVLRRYLQRPDYQIARVSKSQLEKYRWLQPKEVQDLALPYLLIEAAGRTRVSTKIKSIREDKNFVYITTQETTKKISKLKSKAIVRDPAKALRQLTTNLGPNDRIRLRLGDSTTFAFYTPRAFGTFLPMFLEQYGEDLDDFFEGVEIFTLDAPSKASGRKRAKRKARKKVSKKRRS